MASKRPPQPTRPRVKDAKRYERRLRSEYFDLFFGDLQRRLAQVAAIDGVYKGMRDALAIAEARGLPRELVAEELAKIQHYHKEDLIRKFRSALGIDVRILLADPVVFAFMQESIDTNVGLIKTIPRRFNEGLTKRVEKVFAESPFDQQALKKMLKDEYKSSGYNLRRITRDQTSKQIGALTRIRHEQLGIEGYMWLTSEDERVRPTHVNYNRKWFRWSNPPPEGHPGFPIQCRCTAQAAITDADRERLKRAVGG